MLDLARPWPLMLNRTSTLFFVLAVAAILIVLYQIDAVTSLWMQGWPQILRDAFRAITDLGLSDWILVPALAILIGAGVATLLSPQGVFRQAAVELTALAGFFFVGNGVPGLIANVIKRLVGRGRPEYFEKAGALDFQHFVNDNSYQSFPSGHTTTIFALCFVLSFLLPRLLPWMLAVAALVGLSRIVIGVHYPTDVLGGILLGTFGAYAVRNLFASRGWLFERLEDGTVRRRPLTGLQEVLRRRP